MPQLETQPSATNLNTENPALYNPNGIFPWDMKLGSRDDAVALRASQNPEEVWSNQPARESESALGTIGRWTARGFVEGAALSTFHLGRHTTVGYGSWKQDDFISDMLGCVGSHLATTVAVGSAVGLAALVVGGGFLWPAAVAGIGYTLISSCAGYARGAALGKQESEQTR